MLSANASNRIQILAQTYPTVRTALLPALHIAQDEAGYLNAEAIADVATLLDLPYSDVEEVVTFYSMFYENRVGRYVLEVCKTVPCAFLGADEIIEYIGGKLGIAVDETTPDGAFTLKRVECLAACHRAPVMQVNARYHENLTPEKVDRILAELRSG